MNFPSHLQISLNTAFDLFQQENTSILTHQSILQLLNFAFKQLGVERLANQNDLDSFLKEYELQNTLQIGKQHFGTRQFLNFSRKRTHTDNQQIEGPVQIKIPIQPFLQELQSTGCTFIDRSKIRQFLINIHTALEIPNPVEDLQIEKFINDFDANQDGQLETSDLKGIQSLKFLVRKCRRYQ